MNEDWLVDLVLQITTENLEESLQTGDSVLTGETYDWMSIKGRDEITIVPSKE